MENPITRRFHGKPGRSRKSERRYEKVRTESIRSDLTYLGQIAEQAEKGRHFELLTVVVLQRHEEGCEHAQLT